MVVSDVRCTQPSTSPSRPLQQRHDSPSDKDGWQVVTRKKVWRRVEYPQPRQEGRPVPADLVGLCFNCFIADHVARDCRFLSHCLRYKCEGHQARFCKRPCSPDLVEVRENAGCRATPGERRPRSRCRAGTSSATCWTTANRSAAHLSKVQAWVVSRAANALPRRMADRSWLTGTRCTDAGVRAPRLRWAPQVLGPLLQAPGRRAPRCSSAGAPLCHSRDQIARRRNQSWRGPARTSHPHNLKGGRRKSASFRTSPTSSSTSKPWQGHWSQWSLARGRG